MQHITSEFKGREEGRNKGSSNDFIWSTATSRLK